MFPEFVKAEGLTEAQFRDACEKEMQGKDPGGTSFMHALISSWEFSRQASNHTAAVGRRSRFRCDIHASLTVSNKNAALTRNTSSALDSLPYAHCQSSGLPTGTLICLADGARYAHVIDR